MTARSEAKREPRLPGTVHSVADDIKAGGGQATGIRVDMRDVDGIFAGVERAVAEFGRLDIIVNNAAVQVPGTIETVEPRHLELMWGVDLRGPLMMIGAALPHLRAAGTGHIINISSRAGVFPGPGPYDRLPGDQPGEPRLLLCDGEGGAGAPHAGAGDGA